MKTLDYLGLSARQRTVKGLTVREKVGAAYGLMSVVVAAILGSVVYQTADARGHVTRVLLGVIAAVVALTVLTAVAATVARVRRNDHV